MSSVRSKSTGDSLGMYLREIRQIPLLTPEEEKTISRRAQKGDQKALDQLVQHNLRFVVSIAKRYANPSVPFEDLINEGNLGLIRAAKRFDVDRGFRFISYAVWWIRQAILQYLAEQSRLVRLPLNKSTALTRIHKASDRMGQELGRDPTTDEVARRLHVKPEVVEKTLGMPTKQFSIDDAADGEDNNFQIETLSDERSLLPDVAVMESTLSEDVESALSSLNAREEDVLKRYYGLGGNEPHTLEEIGHVYRLTRERVRQIRDRAILRLRDSDQSTLLWEHSAN